MLFGKLRRTECHGQMVHDILGIELDQFPIAVFFADVLILDEVIIILRPHLIMACHHRNPDFPSPFASTVLCRNNTQLDAVPQLVLSFFEILIDHSKAWKSFMILVRKIHILTPSSSRCLEPMWGVFAII